MGAANGAIRSAPFVPCHRIVGSDGRLTGYGPGLPLKARLLAMEGAIPADAGPYDAWVDTLRTRQWGASARAGDSWRVAVLHAGMRTEPRALGIPAANLRQRRRRAGGWLFALPLCGR